MCNKLVEEHVYKNAGRKFINGTDYIHQYQKNETTLVQITYDYIHFTKF